MTAPEGPPEFTGKWDLASLPASIHVGQDCWIEQPGVFGRYRSELPVGCRIGTGTAIYTWSSFNVEPTGTVEIGEHCVLTGLVLMCADRIVLGDRVRVSYNVTVADSDFHPLDAELRRADAIANRPGASPEERPPIATAPVFIEDDVEIGMMAIVLKGVRIGSGARVLPGSVVSRDVPAGATVAGNPAVEVRSGS